MLISTDAFVDTCKGMAKLGGMPDIKYAVVPHPLGSLPDALLIERAEAAVEKFVAIVTEP